MTSAGVDEALEALDEQSAAADLLASVGEAVSPGDSSFWLLGSYGGVVEGVTARDRVLLLDSRLLANVARVVAESRRSSADGGREPSAVAAPGRRDRIMAGSRTFRA